LGSVKEIITSKNFGDYGLLSSYYQNTEKGTPGYNAAQNKRCEKPLFEKEKTRANSQSSTPSAKENNAHFPLALHQKNAMSK
jgi:hypothetical protein